MAVGGVLSSLVKRTRELREPESGEQGLMEDCARPIREDAGSFRQTRQVNAVKDGPQRGLSEMDEILSGMSEARANLDVWKVETTEAGREKKRREEAAGVFVVERSLKRKNFKKLNVCPFKDYG